MRQPFISAQRVRLWAGGRPTGSYPETGLEEMSTKPTSGDRSVRCEEAVPTSSDPLRKAAFPFYVVCDNIERRFECRSSNKYGVSTGSTPERSDYWRSTSRKATSLSPKPECCTSWRNLESRQQRTSSAAWAWTRHMSAALF